MSIFGAFISGIVGGAVQGSSNNDPKQKATEKVAVKVDKAYCRHNGEKGVSAWDIAEHAGNGEAGSIARDVWDTGKVQEALKEIGEQLQKE